MSYQLSPEGNILGADGNPLTDSDGNTIQVGTEGVAHIPRDQIRGMEERANQSDAEKARADAAERKLAFVDAGIDIKDPKMTYFMKGYDGETDPEKIRTAAAEAGFIAPPAGESTPADEAAAQQQQTIGNEAFSNPSGIPLEDAIKGAKTEDEVMQILRDSQLPIVESQ